MNANLMEKPPLSDPEEVSKTDARQGAHKRGMPRVLAISVAATAVAVLVLLAWFVARF